MLAIEEVLRELSGEDLNEQGLPPGFRFHPTDEELITFYLASKVYNGSFSGVDIAEVDLNRCEPWELPDVAKMGEREWYFFSLRDRKYPTGLRTNRATGAGYWKATGKDREVYSASTGGLLGMKKTLVFYKGRAPRGEKTKWVMHEYRLDGDFSSRHTCKEEWVICRIYHKTGDKKNPLFQGRQNGYLLEALPALMETTPITTSTNNTTNNNTNSAVLEYQGLQNPLFLNQHQENDPLKSLIMMNVSQQSQLIFPTNGLIQLQPSFSPTNTNTNTSTTTNHDNNTITTTTTTSSSSCNNTTSPSAFQSMLLKSFLSHRDCTSKQEQLTVPKQCKAEAEASFSHFQPTLSLPLPLPLPNPFLYHQENQIISRPQTQEPSLFDQNQMVDDDDDDHDYGVLAFSSASQLHDMSTSLAFNRAGFLSMLDPHLTKPPGPGGESWPLDA